MPPYFCPYLRHIWTDFKNSFTGTLCGKFAIVIINFPTTSKLCCYTTLWNINVSKTNKLLSVRAHSNFSDTSESSDSDRSKWSVRHWIVFDLSLWIPDMLNDVFVAGLPGLVPVYQRKWSRSLQYARASVCHSHAFCRCFLFPESFQ